jgi:hypothetical protein
MYCTDDASGTLGDGTKEEGEMSPKNLLTTTTDELRMGTNFKGKVIGMSLKDRGAIYQRSFCKLHFGTAKPGHSFLVLYGKQLPDWVRNSMMKSIICHILIMVGTCIDQKLFIMKA